MSSYETLIDELQDELAMEKEQSCQRDLEIAQNEKLIEELQDKLEKEREYSSGLEKKVAQYDFSVENLQNELKKEKGYSSHLQARIEQYEISIASIYNKQKRDRENTEVVFAVEHDLGEIDHEGPSYEAAKRAAEFYDDAIVVTRSIMATDWQEVTDAES